MDELIDWQEAETDLYRSAEDIASVPAAGTQINLKTSSSVSESSDTAHKKCPIILLGGTFVHQKEDPSHNDGPKPSTPQDVAKVHMTVGWRGDLPPRWRNHLQKALQTWCNSELLHQEKRKCSVLDLQLTHDGLSAEVEITPSTALKDIKTATLTFKQLGKSAVVSLHQDRPTSVNKVSVPKVNMTVTATIDMEQFLPEIRSELKRRFIKQQVGTKLHMTGSLGEIQNFYRELCESVGAAT